MNVIKHKWIFLSFSGLLIIASIYGLFVFGLQKGVDFTGGTLWQISFDQPVAKDNLNKTLRQDFQLTDATITEQEEDSAFIIRTKEMSELNHQDFSRRLTSEYGHFTELSFESIGAAIGSELANKALWAFGINLLAISLYIAYAFRKVSHPVSSWKYAAITLITLFHDAIIPVGLFTFLGHYLGLEVDVNFIVAILVVIGFSVHDTIVVFDRIRENLRGNAGSDFGALVNRSINETFARSINTSLTLFIVLIALFILGAVTLKYFILTILVGTIAGTYSSIFVASPLLVVWQKASQKPRK